MGRGGVSARLSAAHGFRDATRRRADRRSARAEALRTFRLRRNAASSSSCRAACRRMETFDPKPLLGEHAGRKHGGGYIIPPRFGFQKHGESGTEVSEIFPNIGSLRGRAVFDPIVAHRSREPLPSGARDAHGFVSRSRSPSLGSWISYGLGTLEPALPSFLVLATKLPYAGAQDLGARISYGVQTRVCAHRPRSKAVAGRSAAECETVRRCNDSS